MDSGVPVYSKYLSDCNSHTVISPRSRRTRSRSAAPGVSPGPALTTVRISRRNRSSSPPQFSSRYSSGYCRPHCRPHCCMISPALNSTVVNISNLRAPAVSCHHRGFLLHRLISAEHKIMYLHSFPPTNPALVLRSRYDSPNHRPGYTSQVSEPGPRSYSGREEREGWGEERFHSLDSRYRQGRHNYQPCSESDSEWADDRDGWSDRSVDSPVSYGRDNCISADTAM